MAKGFSKLLGQFMFLCTENKRSFYPTFSPKRKISHLNQFGRYEIFHFGFSFPHPHCLYGWASFHVSEKEKKTDFSFQPPLSYWQLKIMIIILGIV